MAANRFLRIYLNDHLAGATAGVELVKRSLRSNEGTPLGDLLARLLTEIEDDRRALVRIADALGVARDRPKLAAAWAAEKVGRLKLNGRVRGYSPLSRLIELEGLALGVEGKLRAWRALQQIGLDTARTGVDLEQRARDAEAQLASLEEHRLRAAAEVLGPV